MRFFSLIFLVISFLSHNARAEVDQTLIDNVYAMTSPIFVKDGNTVSRPVQTLNMLAHELSLYPDERLATAAAKSIISMVAKGEGVRGGLRKATSGPRRFLNITEKEMVREALTKAADYLQQQNQLDAFLGSEVMGMVGVWDDVETRKHGSIVLSLLIAGREKLESNDIATAKARAISLVPETANVLLAQVMDDTNWHSATAYLEAPDPAYRYNAIEWKAITERQTLELSLDSAYATRIITALPIKALNPASQDADILNAMAEQLEQTLISEKALLLSTQIMESLKHAGTDLSSLINPASLEQINFRKAVIRALTAVEKFRMLEIKLGGLDRANPTVFDYINGQDSESQAVLVTLVSAIQNYLYNPASTVLSLVKLFGYQANHHSLAHLEVKLKGLDPTLLITEELRENLAIPIVTNHLQNILIDVENLKQKLRFFWMPTFDKASGTMAYYPTFIRYYGSSGASNQCGFFSLGFTSRKDAKEQIVDNLIDPEIYALADTISATSGNIKYLMNKYIRRSRMHVDAIRVEIEAEIQEKIRKMEKKLIEKQEAEKSSKIWLGTYNAKKTLTEGEEAQLKLDSELIVITNILEKLEAEKSKRDFLLQQIDAQMVEIERQIKAAVTEAIDKETEEKLARIPYEAKELIERAEAKDISDTQTLMEKIKAHQGMSEVGLALASKVVEFYLMTVEDIEARKLEMDKTLTSAKLAAGFPEKIPDREEIARTVYADSAALQMELQVQTGNVLKFPIAFKDKQAFKNLVTDGRFNLADHIASRLADELRIFNEEQRTRKTSQLEARLTELFYSLNDFRQIVWDDMHNVFAQNNSGKIGDVSASESQELLEFPPQPEWTIPLPTYPYLLARLNNYNIGGWTSKGYLATLQSGRTAEDRIIPIYQTENDGGNMLLSVIYQQTQMQKMLIRPTWAVVISKNL